MSAPLRMFIPLTKVDAEQRLVYGLATAEAKDRAGEVCDYATTKPFYEKWSGDIAKATDGKSLGNVRVMHGTTVAGVVKTLSFNDAAKQIEICAKVVDDAEWKKVQEGAYTGFSQGGSYEKRWKDEAGLQRYTANPCEVSLVDLPCLPDATFQMVKGAGAIETKPFDEAVRVKPPSDDEVMAKATELANEASRGDEVQAFVEPAREMLAKAALPVPPEAPKAGEDEPAAVPPPVADGVEQVWLAKDKSTHAKKADALAKNAELDAAAAVAPSTKDALDKLSAVAKSLGIDEPEPAKIEKPDAAPPKVAKAEVTAETLAKDLYTASYFADLLSTLRCLAVSAEYEAMFSGEAADSAIAKDMKAWVAKGCSLLVAIVQNECDELGGDEAMMMAAGAGLAPKQLAALGKLADDVPSLAKALPVLQKAGARNSKADGEKIQSMHDNAVSLGASCGASKAGAPGDLAKALSDMTADRDLAKSRGDALQKTIDEQIVPMLTKIGQRIENIEKQPLPLPLQGAARTVSKGADEVDTGDLAERLTKLKTEDPEGYSVLMIKAAQSTPLHFGPAG